MQPSPALEKLRQICSRQEKAPADIITFLKRWGVEQEHHQNIIKKLKSEKFIDEHRYAAAFIRDKMKFDHWGFIKIRMMLQQKGIERSVIEEKISECDRDEYRTMIGHELAKKRKTLKGTPYEIWAKLARYGSSRGYAMEDMKGFLGNSTEE
jgi:regulatory protein